MNDIAQGPDAKPGHDFDAGHPGSRLAAYQARTEVPLDLLALVMLWFVLVPPWHYSQDVRGIWWGLRIALSVVYGIDLAIRSVLSKRPGRYVRANPLALAAVLFPPVRAIFSLRLVRAMFRRGHLPRFLLAAAVLVFDGAIIVYLYERHTPHSNIHTLGESLWFSVVTVTTVGYGDYTPVPPTGGSPRSSSCSSACSPWPLSPRKWRRTSSHKDPAEPSAVRSRRRPTEVTLAELDRRLARIEELLTVSASSSQRIAKAPGAQGENQTQPTNPKKGD